MTRLVRALAPTVITFVGVVLFLTALAGGRALMCALYDGQLKYCPHYQETSR